MGMLKNSTRDYELKTYLDLKADEYNTPRFIADDPIQIPHQFECQEDIAISAFLTATIAWGKRSTIIANAERFIMCMQGGPHEFLQNAGEPEFKRFNTFRHRTFNGSDSIYFLKALKRLYREEGGLCQVFQRGYAQAGNIRGAIHYFRKTFFKIHDPGRTAKHLPDVMNNSSAKRINMFLRWMVRKDGRGVDFGIWSGIPMSALHVPLDVHIGRVARKLGLLRRKQNDWKAVEELTIQLRNFDPVDPVRYDFALFGLGKYEFFRKNIPLYRANGEI
jgi:uncharacterized protein (TIGR02757 family)